MLGLDIAVETEAAQQMIGFCAQDDILWDDLTAREHMTLIAAFKGLKLGAETDAATAAAFKRLGLADRAGDYAKFFSGGMKRRLSVAMCTVGDVEVVILDGEYSLL